MIKKLSQSLLFFVSLICLIGLSQLIQHRVELVKTHRKMMQDQGIDATDLFYTDSEAGMAATKKYFGR